MKKFIPVFLCFILTISYVSLMNVSALDDITLEVSYKLESDSRHYETALENDTMIDNYANMKAYNAQYNWVNYPYGNINNYVSFVTSYPQFTNISVVNKNDGINNYKALEITRNNKLALSHLDLFPYYISGEVLNYSYIFESDNLNEIYIRQSFYFGVNNLQNNLYNSGNGLGTRLYMYNGSSFTSSYFNLENNTKYKVEVGFSNISKHWYMSIFNINNTLISTLIQSLSYVSFTSLSSIYHYAFENNSIDYTSKNITFYAIDCNYRLKTNINEAEQYGSSSTSLDPYYTSERIYETYNVNDESYETFDYVDTIADKIGYEYDSANISLSYCMVPTYQKYTGSSLFLYHSDLVNALNITFLQSYSTVNIIDSLYIENYTDFIKYLIVEHPYNNYSIGFSNGTNSVDLWFYTNGQTKISWGGTTMELGSNKSIYALREYGFGLGQSDYDVGTASSIEVRNNTYRDIFRKDILYDFQNQTWKIVVKNYHNEGVGTLGNMYLKGIDITNIDRVGTGTSNTLELFPSIHSNYTYYNSTYQHIFNYPDVSGYQTYEHYIAYINVSLDIDTTNEFEFLAELLTENQTNYFVWNDIIQDDFQHLYGYAMFYYNTIDTYWMNISDYIDVYGSSILLEFDYTFTYLSAWYYYQYPLEMTLFQTIFELLVPIGLLIMFPYVFGRSFGKKGAVIGLIMGIIILGVSELVSFTLSMILVLMGLGVGVIVWKAKDSNERNDGAIYFD